jgi:hypothetical protein
VGKHCLRIDIDLHLLFLFIDHIAHLVDSAHGGHLAPIALGLVDHEVNEL